MQVLLILFASGFTYAVCVLAGKTLLQVLGVKLYRSEEWFAGFVLGSVCLSTMVFALTAVGLAYTATFLGLGCAVILLALWRRAHRFSAEDLPQLQVRWRVAFLLVYGVFAILYLKSALAPETGSDALAYHAALPARYFRAHHFPANTRNMMANLSEGVELLFLFAYPFAKQSAGAMVHLLFTLVTPLGMLSFARRAGFPEAGASGAVLFFVAPVVGKLGTIGYIDVAVACYVFAVFYLLEIWRAERLPGLPAAIGLVAGFCFAAKYTAAVAVPFAVCYMALSLWRSGLSFWRPVMVTGFCALATMSPYLLKNAVVVGNPLSPFANRYFPNPVMTVTLETQYASVMRHWEGVTMAQVPREITVGGGRLQGIVGPVFVLSPLAVLALWFPAGRRLLAAAAIFGLPYFASIGTRFLVPALPFVALSLAWVLGRWGFALAGLVLLHVILSWPTVVPRYCDRGCWRLRHVDWQTVLRRETDADYLRRQLVEYEWGLELERRVPSGEPIFSFRGFQQAYHTHEIIVEWQSSFGKRLKDGIWTQVWEGLQPDLHYSFEFPKKAVRRVRLFQAGSNQNNEWGVAEMRLFRQGAELPRSRTWRLKASHNPWEVQQAFDNNPVTRWTSGQPCSPGMWIQIDLGEEETLDRVDVQTDGDHDQSPMRMEFEAARGRWETLADRSIRYLAPAIGLRRAAMANFRANHVRWLMLQPSDFAAEDMLHHQKEWGVGMVASDGRYWLYRID